MEEVLLSPVQSQRSPEDLTREAQSGNNDALAELVRRFRLLARATAERMNHNDRLIDDCESICVAAFVRLFPRFDPERLHFDTYWRAKARHAILDFYRDNRATGRRNIKLTDAYVDEVQRLRDEEGLDAVDLEKFAQVNKVSLRKAWRVALAYRASTGVRDVSDDFVYAPDASLTPAEVLENASINEHLLECVARLPEKQRRVVAARFGLHGTDEEAFPAIGARIGVTAARANQIYGEAMKSLRKKISKREVALGRD